MLAMSFGLENKSLAQNMRTDRGPSMAQRTQMEPQAKDPLQARNALPSTPFKQIVREKNIQNKNNPESEPSLLPGEEYIKTPVEQSTLSKSDEVDSLNRRVAMQKFLKKMEAEFGLSVTEIVEAFSQLSPQDLMKPPDQSVAKVVKLLGLDQEGQSKALSFFQDLLEQSESVGVNDYLKSNGRKISLEIISEEQSRKRDLENSLAKMSQAFFVDNHNRLGNKEADQNEALKAGIAGGLESAKEYHSLGFGEKEAWRQLMDAR